VHPQARLLAFCALTLSSVACRGEAGDDPVIPVVPPPAGKGNRIYEIADPKSPKKAAHDSTISVSGAVVVAVDQFDETRNGKSVGTIYVADLGSKEPYSGTSLYNPSFVPGNLRVGAGDALDLRGTFQENQDIPIKFAKGAFLVQISNAIGTFRFDAKVPEPVDVDIHELENYETGRKWLNMIVRVKNVTLEQDLYVKNAETGEPQSTTSGRVGSRLLPETNQATKCEDPFPKSPTVVNELMDVIPLKLAKGTTIKELVGVVTFFCNLHIAPRTPADIKL
jgi:hypothetical protein